MNERGFFILIKKDKDFKIINFIDYFNNQSTFSII
jgi:hypothetical protein